VVPEQRHPAGLDHRQVIAPVLGDEDRDLGYLVRAGAASGQRAAKVGERLVGLD
jgi:hypothetical protein